MITILQGGHHCFHPTDFHIKRPVGLPIYLFLLIKSPAYIEMNHKKVTVKPNTVILFDKNTSIHYGALDATYINDWLRFDVLDEASFLPLLNIPFNTPIYLPNITYLSSLIHLMVQKVNLPESSQHHLAIINHLMHSFLLYLDEQISMPTPLANPFYTSLLHQLRNDIMAHPEQKWTVDAMARTVHLSPSYFQAQYKNLFGCTALQDVISARLEQAKFYLVNTDFSIRNIAKCCGYDNELHFMRQFKKIEGMTPSDFRKLFISQT